MIEETEIIELKKGIALGLQVKLPKTSFLFIKCAKGYAVCGYFDKKAIEKMDDAAIIVREVKSFKEMLVKKVDYVSPSARKLKINKNMTCKQALEKMV